jgi:hypothetical protein
MLTGPQALLAVPAMLPGHVYLGSRITDQDLTISFQGACLNTTNYHKTAELCSFQGF